VLPGTFRCVFEFRDLSWITPEANKLLTKFRSAFCIYELAGYHSPLTVTTDFAYVRLHGPDRGKYQGSYTEDRLREWSQQIRDWAKTLRAVYVYFDNDQAGFAARNALTLKQMVADLIPRSAPDQTQFPGFFQTDKDEISQAYRVCRFVQTPAPNSTSKRENQLGGVMPRCELCGNDYDKAFRVIVEGQEHIFDSFECAIQALAPQCAHCQCRIIGHGVEANGGVYCCANCARQKGVEKVADRAA
jgi:hypothetical protein